MTKITDVEFVSRQLNPSWNKRAVMAKTIRDFLDVPTHQPARYGYATQADRDVARYKAQLQGLRAHVNCMHVLWLIQSGQIA